MRSQQLLQAAATANGISGYMTSGSYMAGFDNADLLVIGDSVYNSETGDFMKYDTNSGLLFNYGQKEISYMGGSGDIMYDYSGGNVSYKSGNTIMTKNKK